MTKEKNIDDIVNNYKGTNPLQYLYDQAAKECPQKEEPVRFSLKVGSWFLDYFIPYNRDEKTINQEHVKGGIRYALQQMFNYLKTKR